MAAAPPQANVTVTVAAGETPVANAGPDRAAIVDTNVTLDATASLYATGYSWKQTGGPTVVLNGANMSIASFEMPNSNTPLTFTLTATAGAKSSTDTVVITKVNEIVTITRVELRTKNGQTPSRRFHEPVLDAQRGVDLRQRRRRRNPPRQGHRHDHRRPDDSGPSRSVSTPVSPCPQASPDSTSTRAVAVSWRTCRSPSSNKIDLSGRADSAPPGPSVNPVIASGLSAVEAITGRTRSPSPDGGLVPRGGFVNSAATRWTVYSRVMNPEPTSTVDMINGLLGVYYTALAQHQTHVALLDSWGLAGLARSMEARIADEPITIAELLQRLLDLGGTPDFTLGTPNIGATVAEVLDKDLEIQRLAPAGLNAAAEAASANHDATTRVMLEGILADEERHLAWLEAERALLDRLGEPLYFANRMAAPTTPPGT